MGMNTLEVNMFFNCLIVFTILFLPVVVGEMYGLYMDCKCYDKSLCGKCSLQSIINNTTYCKYCNEECNRIRRCVTRKFVYEKELENRK